MKNSSFTSLPAVFAALLLLTSVSAIAEQSGDFSYSKEGKSVTITGYSGTGGDISIPANIAGKPVTRVARLAFYGKLSLTSVVLPAGIIFIDEAAFSRCASLASVTIPEGVSAIGNLAFHRCDALSNVTLPASLETIGQNALSNCRTLTAITVAGGNTRFRSESGVLFDYSGALLIQYPGGKSGGYQVPAGVTRIGHSAFAYCGGLGSVTFPVGLQDIGDNSFRECRGLRSITIPEGVTRIGLWAFYVCSGLDTVSLPDSVSSIGERAFYLCGRLTRFTIPVGVTSIGDGAFSGCGGITEFVVSAGNPTFSAVDGVLFDKQGGTIVRCPQGKSGHFTIPETATAIGNWAFSDCRGITSVTIPASVSRIGEWAFQNCTGLGEVVLPSETTFVGDYAFNGCSQLTTIRIPAGATEIGIGAFSSCYRLADISVDPANLDFASIDGVLFDKKLEVLVQYPSARPGNYEIPTGVTVIRGAAFSGANWLTEVRVPVSVTDIGSFAFAYCSSLTLADFAGNSPRVGIHTFLYAPSGFSIRYRAGSTGFTSPIWNGYPATAIALTELESWRLHHFGSAENSGPGADDVDADGDGQSNLWEYIAGTDPKNSSDAFRPVSHRLSPGPFVMEVSGKSGRSYRLLRWSGNSSETWVSVASAGPLSSDELLTLADPAPPAERAFYKIEVAIP